MLQRPLPIDSGQMEDCIAERSGRLEEMRQCPPPIDAGAKDLAGGAPGDAGAPALEAKVDATARKVDTVVDLLQELLARGDAARPRGGRDAPPGPGARPTRQDE